MLDPNYMSELNNSVVCHSFSYIYAEVLRKIGIDKIHENITVSSGKFVNHSNITFMVGDNVIFADSTRTVIGGDIGVHKFTNELSGIRCELYSEDKINEFKNAKENILKISQYDDMMIDATLPNKSEIENLNENDKLILFNNLICNTSLTNIDFMSYVRRVIELLELNIETRILYNPESMNNIYLKVIIKGYDMTGKKDTIEYLVDSNSKNIFMIDEIKLIDKEQLSGYKSR